MVSPNLCILFYHLHFVLGIQNTFNHKQCNVPDFLGNVLQSKFLPFLAILSNPPSRWKKNLILLFSLEGVIPPGLNLCVTKRLMQQSLRRCAIKPLLLLHFYRLDSIKGQQFYLNICHLCLLSGIFGITR